MSGQGGLLNLISEGENSAVLLGNPSINAFRAKFSKIRNYGKQAFRIDYNGQRDLRLTESSVFQFVVPNYADLLLDTYICLNLPDIWSPIYNPCEQNNYTWQSYDFKWIDDIGFQMVEEVVLSSGAFTLARYSGAYFSNAVSRDLPQEKKDLINRMTGNVPEITDPALGFGRSNCYPSAYYTTSQTGAEPSIRGRQLYIPINAWFTLDNHCAFPLVALQYNNLVITVTLRPIQEIFRVRDVFDMTNLNPYVQPDFTQQQFQMYRFLQTPPSVDLSPSNYANKLLIWNADVHLIANYVFLAEDDRKEFAKNTQIYLIRDVYETTFENVVGTAKSQLQTNGLISNWMFYFQRNDVNLRNEWSNYTNFPYLGIPADIEPAPESDPNSPYSSSLVPTLGPLLNPDNTNTGYFITGDFKPENQKEILIEMAIVFDGNYRENALTSGFYNYVDKYKRSSGGAKDDLYFYNFGLSTGTYQPTGAINLNKFRVIEFEFSTFVPPIDPVNSYQKVVCDGSGNPIGILKSNYQLYNYSYNLVVQEERYNIISFIGGYCGLTWAR